MDLQLGGKRALVTGGSRGIGAAVAAVLAAEGADVALLARDAGALEPTAERIRVHGTTIVTVPADTTQDDAVDAAVDEVRRRLGGVDILVNCAAKPASPDLAAELADLRDEELRMEIETKVLGYLRTARAVVPLMKAQRWGRIINVSGLAARQTGSSFGSIRNVAVAAMTKNLADELGVLGINVTAVHPGLTVTERTPALVEGYAARHAITVDEAEKRLSASVSIGRSVTAEEVADVVAFLASPRSVSINGDAIPVGGGARGAIHY